MVEGELQATVEGKVVIYCNTVSRVKSLVDAGLFQYEAFYSKMSEARKKEVLEDFRAGVVRVVVATSALGMGIDIPDIRLIIHTDEPRDLLDYAQESGRAGRDGLASRAVMVQGGQKSDDRLVRRYLDGGPCRRTVMDEFLDGSFGRMECRQEQGEERQEIEMVDEEGEGGEEEEKEEEVGREVEEEQSMDQHQQRQQQGQQQWRGEREEQQQQRKQQWREEREE
ncbi:hypothetical protein B0A55_11426 [Neofusicoccum parvum]|uniref:Uncharacterized protein n=1 Tax=Neofusicoccum parvum TaxID=310453 RepID=A0ACB5SLK6_9PEZI|nr:hypothetical protein B0A55_11426 [Neofusicoccum parvum]